ncbi:TetR/AcrR family transcriptional regulator [Actinoplanes sp. M2I2]|uniref:TetR/AcrR family transcriptional regulator n=1 Tax=Actinoplanes sp. M2I2 TaxID=1734444 RepID=UPI002020C38A|nr:TetR/AcrR family transcriptional regulator [Actinoplanes sp. M2I2]
MASTTRRASAGADRRAVAEAQILAAAEQLLAGGERFTELGIQRLAAEAGVARSTFYLHFRDKTELLLRLTATLTAPALDLISAAPPESGRESMEQAMGAVIRYYRERRHLLAAVLEVAAYDPAARAAWEAELQLFTERAAAWLRVEQQAGRTAPELEPETASRVFVWGGIQVIANQVLTGDQAQDAAVARELVSLQWYGSFRRPAEDRPGG